MHKASLRQLHSVICLSNPSNHIRGKVHHCRPMHLFFAVRWFPWHLHGPPPQYYTGHVTVCLSFHPHKPHTPTSLPLAAPSASFCLRALHHREILLLSSDAFALATSSHQRNAFSLPCSSSSPQLACHSCHTMLLHKVIRFSKVRKLCKLKSSNVK